MQQSCFSIAYFLNPEPESVIAPLLQTDFEEQAHYDEIRWSEFRGLRALGDYGNCGEEVQINHYRRQPWRQPRPRAYSYKYDTLAVEAAYLAHSLGAPLSSSRVERA